MQWLTANNGRHEVCLFYLVFQFSDSFLVIDTWGGLSGTLHGYNFNAGLFGECVGFRHESIEGKYCLTQIHALKSRRKTKTLKSFDFGEIIHDALLTNNAQLTNGICVPKSCSNIEIYRYGNFLFSFNDYRWENIRCYEPPTVKTFDYFAMWVIKGFKNFWNFYFLFSFVLSVLGVLTALSTIYDVYSRKFDQKISKVFTSFSVLSNFEAFLKINRSSSVINCIDGLKVLGGKFIQHCLQS